MAHPLVRTHTIGQYRVAPEANQDGGVDWFVEADLHDPDKGRRVNYTASLTCATWNGHFSHPWERPIPPSVTAKLEALADRLAAAGLY